MPGDFEGRSSGARNAGPVCVAGAQPVAQRKIARALPRRTAQRFCHPSPACTVTLLNRSWPRTACAQGSIDCTADRAADAVGPQAAFHAVDGPANETFDAAGRRNRHTFDCTA
jgi:hypothetical protein